MILFKNFKQFVFTIICLISFIQLSFAQWQTDDPGTTYTMDKIGIGLSNPNAQFQVKNSGTGFWQTILQNGSTKINLSHSDGYGMIINTNSSNANNYALLVKNPATGEGSILNVKNNGLVLLGTTSSPKMITAKGEKYRLYVNGGALFNEVKVETGWADYVFQEDYELTSLEEVEAQIERTGHLHNTPSAKEIAENGGVELGSMTVNQQEKIEEIFLLYMKK